MFLERLNQISNRITGAVALSLIDKDGIRVESVNTDPSLDLELMAAELVAQVRSISDNHRELAAGDVSQFSITTDELTIMVSSVNWEYYLLLVLDSTGNMGQARFELRRARLILEHDL